MHDPRVGRFLSLDPIEADYPWNSPYAFSENMVIHAIELEGLEAHVLTQNYDKKGEFESSSFVWDETAKPVKDGQIHYVENRGGKITNSVVDADDVDYEGGNLNPTNAPSSIVGTTKYYTFRNNDFEIRQTLMDDWHSWQPDAPEYYLDYGDKYVKRFSKELYPNLSHEGKRWLNKALVNLQTAIELKLKTNPTIELDNDLFQKFAFDSHVDAYENAGLFKLPISDLLKIGSTPDISDLLSANGLRQMKQVAIDYVRDAKKNPLPTAFRFVQFSYNVYKNLSKKND